MKRNWNWPLHGALLLAVVSFASYFTIFAMFPVTRDVPWLNLLLFALALAMLGIGLRRAYGQPERYRGKVAGPITGLLTLGIFGLFLLYTVIFSKQLPASGGAPRVGQPAPEFTLPDTAGNAVSLAALLQTPASATGATPATSATAERSVLLVFYRGYW